MMRNLACLVVFLNFSCANIVTPDGGKRDTDAPKIKKQFPENNAINFISKRLEVTFNEYIKIENTQGIITNPPMIIPPLVEVSGKSLEVFLKDSLKPNTTYSIEMPGVVSDITEGNKVSNLHISFATGDKIDTAQIGGCVILLSTLKLEANTTVALYVSQEDSAVTTQLPDYYTKTDVSGGFSFKNIKRGQYRLVAFQDKNGNRKMDADELFGFAADLANTDSSSRHKIYIYPDPSFTQTHLKDFRSRHYGVFEFVVSPKGCIKRLVENNLWTDEAYLLLFDGKDDDTIVWFSPSADLQDGHFDLYLNDDWYRDIITTHMNNTYIKRPFRSNVLVDKAQHFALNDTFRIDFSNPVMSFDDRDIEVFEDSIKIPYLQNGKFVNNEQSRYRFTLPVKARKNYNILIKPNKFKDVFSQGNDSIKINFTTEAVDDYSEISIRFKNDNGRRILLHLLNADGRVVKGLVVFGNTTTSFKMLKPGKYTLRAVNDKNLNKEWDIGLFKSKIEPETAILLPNQIIVSLTMVEDITVDLDSITW